MFSETVVCSWSQARIAAPAEGGLKSQSGCRPQNPRLGAERRIPLDALTNGISRMQLQTRWLSRSRSETSYGRCPLLIAVAP